jgi:hypothetical protein
MWQEPVLPRCDATQNMYTLKYFGWRGFERNSGSMLTNVALHTVQTI